MPDIDQLTVDALKQIKADTPMPEIIDALVKAHGATIAAQVLERVLHALGRTDLRVAVNH